jgi:DNA-binding response OmpR family regulator
VGRAHADARKQLDEAKLLDVENPTAEALRGWASLANGDVTRARSHVKQALAWGSWCDLARIVEGAIAMSAKDPAAPSARGRRCASASRSRAHPSTSIGRSSRCGSASTRCRPSSVACSIVSRRPDRPMPHTLLVIEDQASVRALLLDYLKEQGYRVEQAADGAQGLALARQIQPDLILLDIMMPSMDGYEFLRAWRKERSTPVILLTAKVEETDKVVGLELGADDYVTKPFGMRELHARIRAVLRRASEATPPDTVLRAGRHRARPRAPPGRDRRREVALTPTEFELLAMLMAAPSRVFERIQLLERLQGYGWEGVERTWTSTCAT